MRYWGLFAAKLAAIALALGGTWVVLEQMVPEPETFHSFRFSRFGQDLPWTLAILFFCLFGLAMLVVAVLDQRYRCRTCARRLRMPVETGSWARSMFVGPPQTKYICTYGHGTLTVSELQISGIELPDWHAHDDMWKELHSLEEASRR